MGWTNLNAVSLPTGSILMEHAKTLEAAQEAVKKRKKQEDEAEPRKKRNLECFICQGPHMAKNCPKKYRKDYKRDDRKEEREYKKDDRDDRGGSSVSRRR